ncbi:NAD-dependent DNA ligase [Fadolivirus algeromassiliense]|jgi:NAD-dependent DNA ligase|uniref:DNA ligase (NAD(+)) n=1 Tax=Fadolivirus FV1/VV64 TaxID=3070911 RepID=A0A7D3QX50_9VIRU|nr:NAD-dependent DNA ligase [Fadolivirus algeromassiliense]QKF94120.1 NAD-dependent DNA ligase [Fadolivirus FV1/VV64]
MTTKINDIKSEINKILENPNNFANSVPIDKLIDVLKQLSHYYYNTDESLVPDAVYDLLRETLEARDPKNPYLQEVGAPVSKDKVDLPYPMASLNKIKPGTEALTNWKTNHKGPYVWSDKLDGVSGLLYKQNNKFRLFTRGDSTSGQDVTHLISYILKDKYKPSKIPNNTAIRGEIIMSKANFEKVKDQYKNARNTIAGLVNSKNYSIEVAKLTDFIGYSIIHPKLKQEEQMKKLQEWEFPTVEHKVTKDLSIEVLSKYLQERRKGSKYEVDGVVVIDSSETYDVKDTNPTYGFAFKMVLADQVAEAKVLDIEWNVSMHGYLKPTIKLEPVKLVGVTIKNATAHNAKYIVDNKLGPGAVVKIVRSGDVIPYIMEVLKPATSGTPKLPDIPYKWTKTGVDLIVKDIHGAAKDAIIIKQLSNFFKVLGVKYISEGIVTKLVENDYKSLKEILTADIDELSQIDGIGEKVLSKIFDNIRTAFETTNLETLMAASNCFGRGLAIKKLKIIVETYPNIMNEKWTNKELKEKILELHGFEEISANQFVDHFGTFKKFFNELENIDTINISQLKVAKVKAAPIGKLFENQTIVFTGFRNKDLEELIISNGGKVTGTVSKNTTLLVYAESEKDTSSKYLKAKELKINTMSQDEFIKKYKTAATIKIQI